MQDTATLSPALARKVVRDSLEAIDDEVMTTVAMLEQRLAELRLLKDSIFGRRVPSSEFERPRWVAWHRLDTAIGCLVNSLHDMTADIGEAS